jgi:GDPmannose 4,6-dehydratase
LKRALITGITGQDGSFLAESLLQKGYTVYGLARRTSWYRPNPSSHLEGRIEILFGDMEEGVDIASAVQEASPDEIYNLASQSRPSESWARAAETLVINGLGAIRLFEAVRHHYPKCHIFHASSSEMYGRAMHWPQDENTPFDASNPYAAAKLYAHQMARIYRESYGMFISCGILFNHESERRPLHFLPQKVAYGAACAALGITESPDLNELGKPIVKKGKLALGNLDISRDWGYAADFAVAMWMMLQTDSPDDYVIGTGKLHSLHDLCATAYGSVGKDWSDYVYSDPALVRPMETGRTVSNPEKANRQLGWTTSVSFEEMVAKMVSAQMDRLRNKGNRSVSPLKSPLPQRERVGERGQKGRGD